MAPLSLKQKIVRWLDWWCASPARTIPTWIALTIAPILSDVSGTPFSSTLVEVTMELEGRLPFSNLNLLFIGETALVLFQFSWFHPVILRLELKSYAPWLAGIMMPPVALAMLFIFRVASWIWDYLPYITGVTAALTATPTLLLSGSRTRPWIGVLAGIAYGVGVKAGGEIESSVGRWAVANLFFGIVLLAGTEPKRRDMARISD
jgi:hypothetical protein